MFIFMWGLGCSVWFVCVKCVLSLCMYTTACVYFCLCMVLMYMWPKLHPGPSAECLRVFVCLYAGVCVVFCFSVTL